MIGIRGNPWLAYQVDQATMTWWYFVENKRQETDDRGRPRYDLRDILAGRVTARGKQGTYQDLVATFG